MKQFNYVITDEIGIHARPAGLIVNEAKKYGINLKPNETFVKPFQKSVFKLK